MGNLVNAAEIRQVLERAVNRLCPRWMQASRDDLVQSAMLRILERHQSGEGDPAYKASYLYKTAHSVLVDEIRRVERRAELSLEHSASALVAGTPDPFRVTEGRGFAAALRECLSRMVESRTLGVTLHLQGHRVPEIARLLGWRVKQADNSVYRGLIDLRECLMAKGYQRP